MRKRLTVIALGGNALLQRGESGTFEQQFANASRTAGTICKVIEKDSMLAITHGNGPQVGATLLRHDAGMKIYSVPAFPMDVCGAETQGFIGYMRQQALNNEFMKRGITRKALTVIQGFWLMKRIKHFRTRPNLWDLSTRRSRLNSFLHLILGLSLRRIQAEVTEGLYHLQNQRRYLRKKR